MDLDSAQHLLAIGRLDRFETGLAEREHQQLADMRIIVRDQDGARHGAQDHGRAAPVNGAEGDGLGKAMLPSHATVAPAGIATA